MTVAVRIEAPRQPELLELMRQGDEFTLALYPPESSHLLGVEELERPGVTVFVARDDGEALGMSALVDRGDGSAELKRMFVPPAARGRGIAAQLLRAVESFAAESGVGLIQLETGPLQAAALHVYEREGFTLIPNFGKYAGDPNSVCYEKRV
ncbi:MAG TPA: GNAT family N-acetyltransferase [Galbitalea sp.]